jgi:hypothetical protein
MCQFLAELENHDDGRNSQLILYGLGFIDKHDGDIIFNFV